MKLKPNFLLFQFRYGIEDYTTDEDFLEKMAIRSGRLLKVSVMDCASYRGVKLLEHGRKVVERLLEKRLRRLVTVDQMQFGFMPGRSTVDAIFILRRMQESYLKKNRKIFIYFVDLEKAFDRVPKKVIEWTLRKKLVPERLVQAVMLMYKGAKTWVQV